jgi:hypothetical protein
MHCKNFCQLPADNAKPLLQKRSALQAPKAFVPILIQFYLRGVHYSGAGKRTGMTGI